ncbi:MAG: protein kinase domain-containing protein [Candidatus Eiseniibacteriota bacterium]
MVAPGTQLGPYTVRGQLGAGGMGEVYRALDTRLDREVALKLLPSEFARDATKLARFRQEALNLATLNHPNIATIYGFEEAGDGTLFLALELVEGQTLQDRLEAGRLPLQDALQVCAQVAEALEVAHERGVIHRDLKPGNVMIGPRGLVKVLDFGLALGKRQRTFGAGGRTPTAPRMPAAGSSDATIDTSDMTIDSSDATIDSSDAPIGTHTGQTSSGSGASGGMQGTPGYMSPEQIMGAEQDERTDVFAFGCVLYECLAGQRAFDGETVLDRLRAPLDLEPDWNLLPPGLPARVRTLLEGALAKDRDSRLADVRSARTELEDVLGIRRAAALRAGEAPVAAPHNLPRSLTSFIGRERLLAELEQRLAQIRLLTLVGMGGSGKTRLALKLAENVLPSFPDGVWLVDLAPLSDASRVELATAVALGLREEPGRPLTQTLIEHLERRSVLLVLDNCEHLVAACANMATLLLHACPDVRLIATSREALGVEGEHVESIPSLELPGERARGAEAHRAFESVRLYIERARQVAPTFDLTDANAGVVGEICRRLDGIPLALELAAARAKILSVEQIRAKLDDRFRLLTGGSRTALPRQQTLRATIQWSYDMLAEREQEFLRRLSVFQGGWTLETATAVVEENGDEFETLDLLTLLVDKSLVVVDRSNADHPRYRFLESVRQFAREMLDAGTDAETVKDRHLDYFLSVGEQAEAELLGPKQGHWFAELELENENLLTALEWSGHSSEGIQKGLRLSGAVARFWSARGHYEIARRAMSEALARDRAAEATPGRAKAVVRAGALAMYQDDYAAGRQLVEEGLRIYRSLGDEKGEARALSGLATIAACTGEFDDSRRFGGEAIAMYRASGNDRGTAVTLHNLGFVALCQAENEVALKEYEEALALFRKVGDREYIALTLADLAIIASRRAMPEVARERLAEAVEIVEELGARREGAYLLEAAAELAGAGGQEEVAVRLSGASRALREAIGSPLVPTERKDRNALLARLEAVLGADRYAMALSSGRLLGFADALAAVRDAVGLPEGVQRGAPAPGKS